MATKKTKLSTGAIVRALEQGATLAEAARRGGVSYATLRIWRQKDPRFAEACHLAVEAGTDLIEAEALRRAVQGVEKPVGFHQGRHVGLFVRDYSDSLLVLLLKARRPDLYRETASSRSSEPQDMTGAKDALLRKFAAADEPSPQAKAPRKPQRDGSGGSDL